MSFDLLEKVQQQSGYPVLQKIDPNTQQVAADENRAPEDKFSQAAIPAVLTGLYLYVQSDEGAETFLKGDNSSNWVAHIFEDNKKDAVQIISAYSGQTVEDTITKMNSIANEAVKSVKENLPADAGIKEVKLFFSHQINNILLYLPAALNMSELLHDTTLDDNTHKMRGPISSLIQSIGAAFSNPVMGEEIKNN